MQGQRERCGAARPGSRSLDPRPASMLAVSPPGCLLVYCVHPQDRTWPAYSRRIYQTHSGHQTEDTGHRTQESGHRTEHSDEDNNDNEPQHNTQTLDNDKEHKTKPPDNQEDNVKLDETDHSYKHTRLQYHIINQNKQTEKDLFTNKVYKKKHENTNFSSKSTASRKLLLLICFLSILPSTHPRCVT